jgi:hypothetical protein
MARIMCVVRIVLIVLNGVIRKRPQESPMDIMRLVRHPVIKNDLARSCEAGRGNFQRARSKMAHCLAVRCIDWLGGFCDDG